MNIKEIISKDSKRSMVLKTLIIENLRIVDAQDGNAELYIDITDDMLNVHDKIHGGVLFTVADSTAGICAVSLGKKVVTLNANINFIKANTTGGVISKGKAIHTGKSTVVVEVETYDAKNKVLLSSSMFTMFVIGEY